MTNNIQISKSKFQTCRAVELSTVIWQLFINFQTTKNK